MTHNSTKKQNQKQIIPANNITKFLYPKRKQDDQPLKSELTSTLSYWFGGGRRHRASGAEPTRRTGFSFKWSRLVRQGAPHCSKGEKKIRAHKNGSSLAHNRTPRLLPPPNHRPTRTRRTPHPVGQPSPPPSAGLLACIACTSCLFLPHLLFLYSHILHALTTRLVAVSFSFVFSIFHVLVEVSLQNCEKQ